MAQKEVYGKLGGVLLSKKSEARINLMDDLDLFNMSEDFREIAFDGHRYSGRRELAQYYMKYGMRYKKDSPNQLNDVPRILIKPYSGGIQHITDYLFNKGRIVSWAKITGEEYWRPPVREGIDRIYDGSILTALTEVILVGLDTPENIRSIIKAWSPLPRKIVLCEMDPAILMKKLEKCKRRNNIEDFEEVRITSLGGSYKDETAYNIPFNDIDTIVRYNAIYNKAAQYVKEYAPYSVDIIKMCTNNITELVKEPDNQLYERID